MSEPISERLDELAAATVALTRQVTILSEAVVDLRRLREQQNDLHEQQVATDQRARLGMVHALDASDHVHVVDERVSRLQRDQSLALRRTSSRVRVVICAAVILAAAFLALQIGHHVETSCPRPATAGDVSKTACALLLPGEPGSLPPASTTNSSEEP